MTKNDLYKSYVADLIFLLKEDALEVKRSNKLDEFGRGRRMAYYEILTTIINQAIAFQIDLKEIHLEDFNPEKEILS